MSEVRGLSAVLQKLNKTIADIELHTKEGLTEAALVVKADSVKGTPIDTGNLRGSAFHLVEEDGKHKFSAIVGYTANYALWVHEMPAHYNFNSGSNKFLEKALLKNQGRILQILVKHAKLK